jgi:hypothetical protein
MSQVLPDTAGGDWAAIDYLTEQAQGADALVVWHRLIGRKEPIELKRAVPLVDLLIVLQFFDEAALVWNQAVGLDAAFASSHVEGSLVFDGGFETGFFGAALGWRHDDVAGAQFGLDTEEKHSGSRSASIVFDGTQNLDYAQLYQSVVVSRNSHYRFRAFLRTDNISTESGMRFEILDVLGNGLDVFTANETATHAWTLEQVEFDTGPQTRLIQIRLRRVPSTHVANALQGTVWIDDVGLFPEATAR